MKQRKLLRTATAAALAVAFVLLTFAITVALTPSIAAAAADAAPPATGEASVASSQPVSAAAAVEAPPVAPAPAAPAAAAGVAEVPFVIIVIDGVELDYVDVPLMVNDSRLFLPFREALVALGVPNDEEHIIWNDDEQSVTVHNGDDVIRLVIGDPVMTLNGEPVEFDAAPYFYAANNRTYIPIRAISELMDRLVSWDDAGNMAFIRNKDSYAETVTVLEKMVEATDSEEAKEEKFAFFEDELVITTTTPLDVNSNSHGHSEPTGDDPSAVRLQITTVDNSSKTASVLFTMIYSDREEAYESEVFETDGTIYMRSLGDNGFDWTDDSSVTHTYEGETYLQVRSSAIEPLVRKLGVEEFAMRAAVKRNESSGGYTVAGLTVSKDIYPSVTGLAMIYMESGYMCASNVARFEIEIDDKYRPELEGFGFTTGYVPLDVGSMIENGIEPMSASIFFESEIEYKVLEPDYEIEAPEGVQALIDARKNSPS